MSNFASTFQFQSTPSVWRETITALAIPFEIDISIHSLRVEGDYAHRLHIRRLKRFQSTPSVWRETSRATKPLPSVGISIHSLRVEGDLFGSPYPDVFKISIHSLRVEGDTLRLKTVAVSFYISIHSLRVEGDEETVIHGGVSAANFNPLPPCGGRLSCTIINSAYADFNPLPPCGGRRAFPHLHRNSRQLFQSTPSVWRETTTGAARAGELCDFNPLPPCGGRPCGCSL